MERLDLEHTVDDMYAESDAIIHTILSKWIERNHESDGFRPEPS